MKKLIAIMLFLCMIIPFAGCIAKGDIKNTELLVGYGREDISPYDMRLPLRGYGNPNDRLSTKVTEPIYVTCVAFTDVNQNTILLYHTDLGSGGYADLLMSKRSISRATGVPAENIMISATHTHSAPEFDTTKTDALTAYIEMVQDKMVAAAKTAMEDRKSAEMYMTTTKVENMNFCRHYNMKDGTVAGDNFGSFKSGIVDHVVKADDDLQILRFVREGKKDVVLVNWQVHPKFASQNTNGTSTVVSSDVVGVMRDYVEANSNSQFAYFSGASGNLNPTSYISSENVVSTYKEYGNKMGEHAVGALNNMTKVKTHNVQLTSKDYTFTTTTDAAPKTVTMYAFSIGDVGFICAPYEMFSENGQQIKKASPFKMTFVVTYANGANAYVASEASYAYNSYEQTYRNYVKGTAEQLVSMFGTMLDELHKTR